MRSLTILTTVLLGSSMLAATAAAQTQSQSPRCKSLEQDLPECQTIGVSAAAVGGALNLLSKDYPIVPIEQTAADVFPSHLVIGGADLDTPQIIALLKRSYRLGKTVAIVGATQDQADRFHRLLRPGEASNCQLPKGQAISSLYGLQRSRYRFPPQNSTYCLVNLDLRDVGADRRWLRERFGLTPPQPAAGKLTSTGKFTTTPKVTSIANAASSDDPNQFLTGLAGATHCSSRNSSSYGAIQADYYVYSMRDFTDTGCSSCKDVGADYYLVQDNLSFQKTSSSIYLLGSAEQGFLLFDTTPGLPNEGIFTSTAINLEFADPVTTTAYESSYTNSSSVTATGSVGFSAEGPNVTLGGSTTTSQEMTYSIPATTIENISNLAEALPQWEFFPQNLPIGANLEVNPTWTWFIPQDAYPSGGIGSGGIGFNHTSSFLLLDNPGLSPPIFIEEGALEQICNVPFPFSAWTVQQPVLSSLSTTSTSINGGTFTITGQYLYPSSVVAVLIGGTPVSLSTNVDLIDAQTIEVAVPGGLRPGTYPVQVNTQFNSEDRFSNTLSLTLTN